MRSSKQLILVLVAVCVAILAPAALNYIVDPYQVHREIDGQMPELRFDARWQNPSLIRYCLDGTDTEFDTVLIGTSMGQNFIPSELQATLGSGRVLKLNMAGSQPEMDLMVMAMVLQSPNVKRVLWEITLHYSLTETTPLSQLDTFPQHLYGTEWSDRVKTLFSADTFEKSFRSLRNRHNIRKYDEWNTWYVEDQWEKWRQEELLERMPEYTAKLLTAYPGTEPIVLKVGSETTEFDYPLIDRIAELARTRPDVEFDFFFPPRSALSYALNTNRLDRLLQMPPYTARLLTQLPGADVHGFHDTGEIVLNLNHYKDLGHYGPEINRWMARAIRDRTHVLTPERIDTYQQHRLDLINQVIEDARAGRLDTSDGVQLPVPLDPGEQTSP